MLHDIHLVGDVSCTRVQFEETIDLIGSGMVDTERYVTDVMPLDQLQHAFERLNSESDPALKVVITPNP